MPFGGNNFQTNRMVPYKEMLKSIATKWPNIERLCDQPNDTSKVCMCCCCDKLDDTYLGIQD
jgi:hypothetical protein